MNIQELFRYKNDGLLINQTHPSLPLIIWNYTAKVQYENLWDDITLNCRGLITDYDGKIISKGFKKFFNIEENKTVATETFQIFEKLDGQYIGVFCYNGELIVNSKGSFTSIYAIEAKKILISQYPNIVKFLTETPINHTFCFELIGFEKIVVNYEKADLILTAVFTHENIPPYIDQWKEYDLKNKANSLQKFNLNIVKSFDELDWKNIKNLNWKNSEGFVVKFLNGDRCKIKFEDYVNLHRQITNISTISIWKMLSKEKQISDILDNVPDEFYNKIKEYELELINFYLKIEQSNKKAFEDLMIKTNNRKEFAEEANKLKIDFVNRFILFALLDGKNYSEIIWNLIKPKRIKM